MLKIKLMHILKIPLIIQCIVKESSEVNSVSVSRLFFIISIVTIVVPVNDSEGRSYSISNVMLPFDLRIDVFVTRFF